MTVLIVLGILALTVAGAIAVPLILMAAAIWVVTLPFRLAFNLLFGGLKLLLGLAIGLVGLLALPLILLIAGIGLTGALVAGLLSLMAPLVPLALLGLLAWGIYRLTQRPTPAI